MSQAPPVSESASRPALVLGTAGHIDHGKTALIRALTGVDTDRLPEEKARGITIDLGFAPLDLGNDLRLSVVDVPGHERLVRTMVAGASGIDLVLLVVAADEGVMPQTREHLAICELLGVRRGAVALTKLDLVDDEMAGLARDEIADALAATGLARAPVVGVSAQTGAGLDELRDALRGLGRSAPPRTTRSGPPRLPVDRVFAMRGFGTVVTGTLVGGALAVGDAVEILPTGRRARVRGVQSHGEASDSARPGARCALNLQGVDVQDVARGDVVTRPDSLAPTCTADVDLWWLPAAPGSDAPSVSVELLTGTSERRARLAPIGPGGDRERITPGWRGFARLHVDGPPLALVPGDRFVARGFARTSEGGSTWGGGVVLDVAPPHRRRSDPEVRRELEAFAGLDVTNGLRLRVERAGWRGAEAAALGAELGLDPATRDEALAAHEAEGGLVRCGGVGRERWLAAAAVSELETRLGRALDAFHAAEPLRPGMPRASLHGSLPENVPTAAAELASERMALRGELVVERDLVRRPAHEPRIDAGTRSLLDRIALEARTAGLEPAAPREWAAQLGVGPDRLRDLLAHLERDGVLVRAPGDLWFDRSHVAALRERVVAHLREHGSLATPAYKALIGTTRRTAVPLMELFDEERLTRRDGNARVLRRPA